jgi:DNA topoisomerase IB
MALRGLPREKVLATVVHRLESTLIRVGNDDSAKQNNSYGLTTLKNRHVAVDGNEVRFRFTGKSGKQWSLRVARQTHREDHQGLPRTPESRTLSNMSIKKEIAGT